MEKLKTQSKVEDRRKRARGNRSPPQGRGAEMKEGTIFISLNLVLLTAKKETILKEVYNA